MSDISLKPIKEQILYDNLDIIDIEQLENDIKYFHFFFNIYSDEKINSIKMSQINDCNVSRISNKKSADKNIEDREQIDEVKYNVIFIIHNKCKFEENNYNDIIEGRYIRTRRLVIIEKSENSVVKKYMFIPSKNVPLFVLENKKAISILENSLLLNGNPLLSLRDLKLGAIQFPFNDNFSSISSKSNDTFSGINLDSMNSGNSSKKSKNDSSENEGIKGDIINYDIENNKFIKYLYVQNYEKEVDGIYPFHEEIKLIKGNIELVKDYKTVVNNYNVNNDLNAFIIYKSFKEYSIPKDNAVIVEVKKSFQLLGVCKQIKKFSKIANNLTGTKTKLPLYAIGIMCSFEENMFKEQIKKVTESKLFESINEKIEDNGIKYVLAVIKEEKIGDYNIGIEDYSIDNKYKRVDISFMNEKLKFGLTSEQIEEMQKGIKYESVNYEKKLEVTISQYNRFQEQNQELQKLKEQNQELLKRIKELEKDNMK